MLAPILKCAAVAGFVLLVTGLTFLLFGRPRFAVQRGVNISHWLSQSDRRGTGREEWFNRQDVALLAGLGFDPLRIPIDEEQMWDEDGKPVPEALPPRIFCEVRGRHPLSSLRFVEPVVPDELKAKSPGLVLAWSICFPPSDVQGGTVEYIVNTIRMREMFGEDEIEEEALGDTD